MKQTNVKEYFKPMSLDEAISILADYKGGIKVVAGATDLFADDHPTVEALVDISKVELSYVKEDAEFLKIGATTTMNQLVNSEIVKSRYHSIWEAAKVLGDKTIRNTATIGGNICSSVSSADSVPPLVVLDAILVIAAPGAERKVKIEEFFTGSRKNVLKKNEILKEIQIPACNCNCGSGFEKMTRNSEDLALVNTAAHIKVDEGKKVQEVKVALGAVAATVVRAKKFEEALVGTKIDEEKLEKLIELVEESISPISDIRCSEEYRKHISKVFAKKTILKAYQRAIEKNKM